MSGKSFYMFDCQKTFLVVEMFSVLSAVVMFGQELFLFCACLTLRYFSVYLVKEVS